MIDAPVPFRMGSEVVAMCRSPFVGISANVGARRRRAIGAAVRAIPAASRPARVVRLNGVMERTQLETTRLGTTDLEITRVGLGAWAIGGGGWEFGWGAQEDAESLAAIDRALELGVNWIDTAAAYGFGHSERVVGAALSGLDPRPYVFTKASLLG